MPKLRLDPIRDRILGLYEMGRMPSEIARDLAMPPADVSRYLGALRNAKILPKAKEDPRMKGWIIERVQAGRTLKAISEEVGMNPSYVEELVFALRTTGDLPSAGEAVDGGKGQAASPPLTESQERMVKSLRLRGHHEADALAQMRSWYASRSRRHQAAMAA